MTQPRHDAAFTATLGSEEKDWSGSSGTPNTKTEVTFCGRNGIVTEGVEPASPQRRTGLRWDAAGAGDAHKETAPGHRRRTQSRASATRGPRVVRGTGLGTNAPFTPGVCFALGAGRGGPSPVDTPTNMWSVPRKWAEGGDPNPSPRKGTRKRRACTREGRTKSARARPSAEKNVQGPRGAQSGSGHTGIMGLPAGAGVHGLHPSPPPPPAPPSPPPPPAPLTALPVEQGEVT